MSAPPVKRMRSRALDDSGVGDMSTMSSTPTQTTPSAGQILGIELKNFMNHASLDLTLEPNKVNFITGRNGAGKSSVIQAAVLALGGDAKMTKRATNMGSFVRHDCNKAEIRVRLSNVGDDHAFRPEVYGSAIIMERTIYISPGGQVQSRHAVRNAGGKIVYETSKALEEKKHICQHFVIQLDNPTTILQQEEAKVFFTNNSDSKRYEFFFKATTLHAAKGDYKKAREDASVSSAMLEEKDEGRREKEQEEKKMKKQFDLIMNLESHGNTEMMSAKELIIKARMAEETANKLSENIVKLEERAKLAEEKRQEKGFEMKKIEREYEEGMLGHRRTAERLADLTAEVERAGEEERAATERLKETEQKVQGGNIEVARLRDQIRNLNNEIVAQKKRSGQSARETDAKRLKLQTKLNDLNKEREDCQKKIEEAGNKRKELENRRKELQMERSNVIRDRQMKDSEKKNLEKSLKQLQRQQEHSRDSYRVFGMEFENLMADIERNAQRFSAPPLGPVGKYVRLVGAAAQNRDLCDLIESDMGRGILRSFVVNTMEDQRELQVIFARHFRGGKPPNITRLQFRNDRIHLHDGIRAYSTDDYTVVMDHLQFDNDMVYNYLISQTDIATTLVLTDDQAEHLFSDRARVPRNARKAITTDFYRYFPAGNNKNYSSYYIERNNGRNLLAAADTGQREIHDLTVQIADMQTDMERKKLEMDTYTDQVAQVGQEEQLARDRVESERRGFQAVNVEIQRCMAATDDLAHEDNSAELQQHVEEKENTMSKKKIEVETFKDKMKELRVAGETAKRELAGRKGELAAESPSNDSQQKLKLMEEQLKRKRNQWKHQESIKAQHKRDIEKAKRDRDEKLRSAEDFKKEANEKTNGEDIGEVTETLAELKMRQIKIREQKQEYSSGLNREEFQAKFMNLKDENSKINKDFAACSNHVQRMDDGMRKRGEVFVWTRDSQGRQIKRTFSMLMAQYRLFGKLHFKHKEERLNFEIAHLDADGGKVGECMPLSSFSGGERSRTLACFILSLWEMNVSPFRALDELDVYLDEVNRAQVEEQLIEFARMNKEFQFIFISPQPPTDEREINVIEIEKQ